MRLRPSRYQAIGFSLQKVRALLVLARAIERRRIDLEWLVRGDDDEVCARLLELRAVGRWTAEYVLLRGLGRLHVFPGDAGVQSVVEPWQPYAGLVYLHLLLDGLSHAGALEAIAVTAGKPSEGLGQ